LHLIAAAMQSGVSDWEIAKRTTKFSSRRNHEDFIVIAKNKYAKNT
jgi:hypothetical protein